MGVMVKLRFKGCRDVFSKIHYLFSEEAVEAIKIYLEFERLDIKDDASFSRYQSGGDHMNTMVIQHSYRELNRFLGWVPDDGGF